MSDSKITLDFLQSLFFDIDPSIHIESFEQTVGSGRGDNYTSTLFRIKLTGTTKKQNNEVTVIEPWETSIICKCLPENPIRREAFKSQKLFKNEVAFYNKVVPLYKAFQEKKKDYLDKQFKALPRCFYAADDLIILEDMKSAGFEMADRKQGLNMNQITSVLTELAQFHAISMAIKISTPLEFYSLFDKQHGISEGLFIKENEEWYRDYYKQAINNVVEMISSSSEDDRKPEIIKKFLNFADDSFFQKMCDIATEISSLSVLCHGDCWTNNILFKPVEDNGLEACFVDFQLCRYGSLALDLSNLIFCCTTRKLRDGNLNSLLGIYHDCFHTNLKNLLQDTEHEFHKLTVKAYSFSLLLEEFRKFALFGLGLALDIIPISTCNSNEAPDMYEEKDTLEENASPLPTATNALCSTKMINLICELIDCRILQ